MTHPGVGPLRYVGCWLPYEWIPNLSIDKRKPQSCVCVHRFVCWLGVCTSPAQLTCRQVCVAATLIMLWLMPCGVTKRTERSTTGCDANDVTPGPVSDLCASVSVSPYMYRMLIRHRLDPHMDFIRIFSALQAGGSNNGSPGQR